MTRIIQVDGAPGAGKTHTLQDRLRREADGGLGPFDFYWLTFTNAGRKDVEPEITEVFADSDADRDAIEARAKTFHGLALSRVMADGIIDHETMTEQVIMQSNGDGIRWYKLFCERMGMTYDPDYANPRKLLKGEANTSNTGNLLFAIDDYLTQTMKPPEKWGSAPVDIPIEGDRVVSLLEAWGEFKRTVHQDFRLFEHGDYVKEAIDEYLVPSVDVLLIDEFQDLAPLEYKLYKRWRDSGELERIYIAGDPNQSIYSFRGGTPYYFDNTAFDEQITLKESWRCPREIAKVGTALLDAHTATDPRGFEGRDEGGTVGWRSLRNKHDLHDAAIDAATTHDGEPSVFFLTRTNYQLRQLLNDLRDVGIPFEVLGSSGGVWRDDLGKILAFLNAYDAGESGFNYLNVRTVLEHLPNPKERRKRLGRGLGDVLDRDAVDPAIEDFAGALEIVLNLDLPKWKRDVLANAVDAPADISPSEVRVGTIHTSKGLEAPRVYLFTTSSDRTLKRYSRDATQAAEEHRTYYVGATRASRELYFVNSYFEGPTAPPIDKIRSNNEVIA